MAILTGPEIKRQMNIGNIVIEPPPLDEHIGPNSVDVHLARLFVYGTVGSTLDPENLAPLREVSPEAGGRWGKWLLSPGRLYIGETVEYTETHGFVPYLDGRSSWGRLGLAIHTTAGRGDDGFKGKWTLELHVVQTLYVGVGARVGQVTYHTMEGKRDPYKGRYQDSNEAKPAIRAS